MGTSKLLLFLKLFLSLFFLFSAVSKLFPLELFELKLINDGYATWDNVRLISTLLISLESLIAFSFFVSWMKKRNFHVLVILFLLLMCGILIKQLSTSGNSSDCGCFGGLLSLTPIESLFKNLILISLICYLFIKDRTNYKIRFPAFTGPLLLFIMLSCLSFFYPDSEFQKGEPTISEGTRASFTSQQSFSTGYVELNKGEHLVLFISAACDHCKEIFLRHSILSKQFNIPKSTLFIWGNEDSIKDLFSLYGSSLPYASFTTQQFFAFREKGFPKVYFLRDGIIQKEWNHQSFSYAGVARLFKKRSD